MSETSMLDESGNCAYDVVLPRADTGLGSIWTADYFARSKTFNPPLLPAGSTEYNQRATQGMANGRLLDQGGMEELATSLNENLIVVGPATATNAMLKYQDNITSRTSVERDRTGAELFDVLSKNWALISRDGLAFQLPLDEVANDPVLPEPPADCFNDYSIDERTYIDRPCITAWRDRLMEKKKRDPPTRKSSKYYNQGYICDMADRPKYVPPPEIAADNTSFTDYVIDERSFIDPPNQVALRARANIKRKSLLRRWKAVKMRSDEHEWHIVHFKRFLAAHELNSSAMRAFGSDSATGNEENDQILLPSKTAGFYLRKFAQFSLFCVLRPPERCVTLNRDPVMVTEQRWDTNKVDTSVSLTIMRQRSPNVSLRDGAEDHFRAFLDAHNANVGKFQTLLDESSSVSKCPTLDKAVYDKLLHTDVLTRAAHTFAATVTATYRDAVDECGERACYGELYYPSAEVWEKPVLVTNENGQNAINADGISASASVVQPSCFAEYAWQLQDSVARNADHVDHAEVIAILVQALALTRMKVNTHKNRSTDQVELHVNWTSRSAQLRCNRHNITVTHSIALTHCLTQMASEVTVSFELRPVTTVDNPTMNPLTHAADRQRWIWWRKHAHPCTQVRLPYDSVFNDDHQRALRRAPPSTTAPPPPPPPPPPLIDRVVNHCRGSVRFLYDNRTLPTAIHKHVLSFLQRKARVVRNPLPLPFRVWRSKYVVPTDPFEKAAYLIHFDRPEEFAHTILLNPSLAHARSWLGESLLEVAAAEGRLDSAALLIEHRADVNHTNKTLGTPLHAAARHGHVDMITLLRRHGAQQLPDKTGQTPLYAACSCRQTQAALWLIECGADVHIIDKAGVTLLDATIRSSQRYRLERSMWTVVGMLLEALGISSAMAPLLCEELRTIITIDALLRSTNTALDAIASGDYTQLSSPGALRNYGTAMVCAALLKQKPAPQNLSLDFSGCHVGDAGAEAIAMLLRTNVVTSLNLHGNELSAVGVATIASAVSTADSALRVLQLSKLCLDDEIVSADLVMAVVGAICKSQLNSINLDANHFDEDCMRTLTQALAQSRTVQNVSFSTCSATWALSSRALQLLCSVLAASTTLLTVSLNDCNLGDDAMLMIADMLKLNTTLQVLNLRGNAVSDAGAVHLAQALRVNSSLRELHLAAALTLDTSTVGEDGSVAIAEAVAVNANSEIRSLDGVQLSLSPCLKVLDLDSAYSSATNQVILEEVLRRRNGWTVI